MKCPDCNKPDPYCMYEKFNPESFSVTRHLRCTNCGLTFVQDIGARPNAVQQLASELRLQEARRILLMNLTNNGYEILHTELFQKLFQRTNFNFWLQINGLTCVSEEPDDPTSPPPLLRLMTNTYFFYWINARKDTL